MKLRLWLLVLLVAGSSGVHAERIQLFADGFGEIEVPVSGTASGISEPITLTNVGVESIVISESGPFEFELKVAYPQAWKMDVSQPSSNETCSVSPSNGRVGSGPTDVLVVTCSTTSAWDQFDWDEAPWN